MVQTFTSAFTQYARQRRQQIDAALAKYVDFEPGCPDDLSRAIRHSLLAPCKRMRPTMVLMAAEACGYDWQRAMPAACAVEMVHTYSLIHDDLPAMDNDDLRRGRPSCHAAFGEATAILAGDALLARAFEILARDVQPGEVAARCCAELAQAAGACALVGGQADDLAAAFSEGDLEQLESIHRRKTGAMFCVALRLGGMVAGADAGQLAALETYGEKLGLAFQIVDDLLDRRGDESLLGKHTGKDSEQGKLTFPALLGVESSSQRAEQLVEDACQAIRCFDQRAGHLEALAGYVVERNH